MKRQKRLGFNGHPPLGVNATCGSAAKDAEPRSWLCFNGHPPLGVNATFWYSPTDESLSCDRFNGHPPLGVNATTCASGVPIDKPSGAVSMGTHPWG